MLCHQCLSNFPSEQLLFHQNKYYCSNCYKNITQSKQKTKWVYILSAGIVLLIIGIGLLAYWYFTQ